jgi:hypothetical protein
VFNCTFYNNTTVLQRITLILYKSALENLLTLPTAFFSGNTTILVDDDLKSAYTYNLLPTSESGWGTGSCYSDNPRFINSTPTLPSHFNIQSSSPAREAGTFTGAPAVDIRGVSRTGACDIGAYEYPAAVRWSGYTWDVSTFFFFWGREFRLIAVPGEQIITGHFPVEGGHLWSPGREQGIVRLSQVPMEIIQ